MEQWFIIFSATASVFAVVLVGAIVRRLNWLTQEADESLLRLIIRVLVPALIFSIIVKGGNSILPAAPLVEGEAVEPVSIMGWLFIAVLPPAVGFCTVAAGVGIAYLLAIWVGPLFGLDSRKKQRTFASCVGIFNYGYIPIPLVDLLYDDATLAVLIYHNVGVELAIWTVGVLTLAGHLGKGWWKHVLNPPAITIVVALIVQSVGLGKLISEPVMQVITMVGRSSIPLGLILVGATMADISRDRTESLIRGAGWRVALAACALRLGVLPLLMLTAIGFLPASAELRNTVLIEAAMPAAVFPVILARIYGGDSPTALQVVIGTSLVCLITAPSWITWGHALM